MTKLVRIGSKFDDRPCVRKYGRNDSIDTTSDPEDVWTAGGLYSFPSAAAATTIVSDSSDDDGDPAGTGALTVQVQGQLTGNIEVTETVTMDGTNAKTLDNQYLRVYRAKVLTAGSGGTNAGTIQIKHGATVLAEIPAGDGQTSMAIYTIPAQLADGTAVENGYFRRWRASMTKSQTASAVVSLRVREPGGAFLVKDRESISNSAGIDIEYSEAESYAAGTDILIRVDEVSANGTGVFGNFDMSFI